MMRDDQGDVQFVLSVHLLGLAAAAATIIALAVAAALFARGWA